MAEFNVDLYRLSYAKPSLQKRPPNPPPPSKQEPGFTIEASSLDGAKEAAKKRLIERGESVAGLNHKAEGGLVATVYAKET